MTHSSYRQAQKSHQFSIQECPINQQQSLGSHHAAFQKQLPPSQAPNQVQPLPGMSKSIINVVQIIPLREQLQLVAMEQQYVIQPQVPQALTAVRLSP